VKIAAAVTQAPKALRQKAIARAGAANAVIIGPDVDTARLANPSTARSARGPTARPPTAGAAGSIGQGAGCTGRLLFPRCAERSELRGAARQIA
jgi:hypothetical protein